MFNWFKSWFSPTSPVRAVPVGRTIFYAGSAIALLLTQFVGQWEGYRDQAYLDMVGVPTICYGETKGVKMGQKKTREECNALLVESLKGYEKEILRCIKTDMPPKVQGAIVSLAYNVGSGAVCKGSVAREANKGNFKQACDNLLKYNRAGGKVVRGLVNRRAQEHKLCMEGV